EKYNFNYFTTANGCSKRSSQTFSWLWMMPKEIWAAIKTSFGEMRTRRNAKKCFETNSLRIYYLVLRKLEKGYDRFQGNPITPSKPFEQHKPSAAQEVIVSCTTSSSTTTTATPGLADEIKKFYKKIGRRPRVDGKMHVAFDKRKVECFNCHNTGHFARECKFKGSKEGSRQEAGRGQISSQMSSTVKIGLGYGIQSNAEVLGYEEEISRVYVSDASSTVYSTCPSNDSDGELGLVSDHSVNDDPIHDHIHIPSIEQVTIATQKTQPQVPKPKQTVNWNQRMERELGAGYSFERKTCFVCGSLSHLIKDCDYYEKKMAREAALKSQRVVHADVRQATPAWTNTNRLNVNTGHGNVSTVSSAGTQIKSGSSRFNTGKQNVNSGRFNLDFNSGSVHVNTARVNRPVSNQTSNKTSPKLSQVNLKSPKKCFSKQSSPVNRPFSRNTTHKSNKYAVKGKMGTAVKTSAGCVWRQAIPLSNTNSGPTPDSNVNVSRVDSKTIKTGRVNVNTGHGNVNSVSSAGTQFKCGASRFNTGKQHVNSGSVHVNSGTQFKSGTSRFNTGKQHINSDRMYVNSGNQNKSGGSRVNTGKQKVNTGEVNTAEVNTGETERVQRRKGKDPMTEEDLQAEVQASKTSKELQELADLEEAQRLQAKMDAETQRQIDLDALLARRLVEQEEEAAQEALATEFDYIQARLNADQILAEKLQQEEREQYSIEDRAKFLHDTIAAQRKFLAEQRSAAIRNKPPTISQLRNQMITYLKHVANKKHAELKSKSFEEIQVLYERYKKQDQTFVAIGTEEDERAIKKVNEKAIHKEEEKKDESVHEEVKEEEGSKKRKLGTRRKLKAKRRKHASGLTREDDDLKICLHIAPDRGTKAIKFVKQQLEEFEDSNDDDHGEEERVTPKTSHLNAVKRIFKYLKGKPNLGLWYPRESPFDLEAFSDSDYGGSNLDRKSTTALCKLLVYKYCGSKSTTGLMNSMDLQIQLTANTLADGTLELQATIDTIVYTITEASIEDKLHLADASGITMLPNYEIFEGMGQMGSKSGEWDQFGSNIATALICLSTGRVYNFSKLIFDGMVANLKSKTKFLMYPLQSPPPITTPILVSTPTPIPETDPEPIEHTFEEPSPAHQHFSSPQEHAQEQMSVDDLLQLVPQLMTRVDSLEKDLKQTKLTMRSAIVKLVKKVKKLEAIRIGSQLEEEEELNQVHLDSLLAQRIAEEKELNGATKRKEELKV
ncbi:uncharacterized mitochondrial protein-like protein, partial [Tanacetum coccineum]